jgi:uncharacterized damage-inducible protein DinB
MKPGFKILFEYNLWANNKLITSLKKQDINDVSVLRLFSHIVLSEQIWLLRLEGGEYSNKNFWEILTLPECQSIINENSEKFENFIDKRGPSDEITYKNSKGIEYTNTIYDVMTHVSLHSAYHRGQIAKEVRLLNMEPVLTDYIAFIREK